MTVQSFKGRLSQTLRLFFGLGAAWSLAMAAVLIAVQRIPLHGVEMWAAAIIPALLPCAMLTVALQRRISEVDTHLRRYYSGALLIAMLLLMMTALLVCLERLLTGHHAGYVLAVAPLALGIVPMVLLLLPARGGVVDPSPMDVKLMTPAVRRIFRFGVLSFVYLLFSLASTMLFDNYRLTGISAWMGALLPVLPVFGLVPIYRLYMAEEKDEFQRHLFHQSILLAMFGTLLIASVVGRLQDHMLIFSHHPEFFRPYSVFPLFWWLQLQTVFLVQAIHAMREMRENVARE
jgi:hypothetical protein